MANTDLEMLSDWDAETDFLSAALRRVGKGRNIEILEAGCGQQWPLDVEGLSYRLTGIDLDADALAMRVEQGDLDEVIHGDLRTAELPDEQFDVIYNSFVIEHIDGAADVLDNFVRWVKPGGVILIRFPDRDSVFGFITRMSPHWFHVLYKRWIIGNKNAGKPGHEPYETFYDPVVSRQGFTDYCARNGLVIQEERGFPVSEAADGLKLKVAVMGAKALGALSFGKLASQHMWLTYVVTKPVKTPTPSTDKASAASSAT